MCRNIYPVPLVNSAKFQLIPKLSTFLGLLVAENLFLTIHTVGTGQEVTVEAAPSHAFTAALTNGCSETPC